MFYYSQQQQQQRFIAATRQSPTMLPFADSRNGQTIWSHCHVDYSWCNKTTTTIATAYVKSKQQHIYIHRWLGQENFYETILWWYVNNISQKFHGNGFWHNYHKVNDFKSQKRKIQGFMVANIVICCTFQFTFFRKY